MRAAILYEPPKPLVISEVRLEAPKYGEVRLRIKAAGICASDHHVMQGQTNFPLPMVLGHEGTGVVEEVGAGVKSLKVGDRCALSFVPFCGYCPSCRSGKSHLCDTHKATGGKMFDGTFRMFDSNGEGLWQFGKLGVFAEQVVVPEQSCFVLEDDISDEVACVIGCAVSTGVATVINQPGISPAASICVVGAGGIGLNCIQAASLINTYPIIAVDIADDKLEFARKFGATHVVNSKKTDAVKAVMEITNGGVQYCIDAFGHKSTTELMVKLLAKGGRGVIVGLAPVGMEASLELVDITRNEKQIVGSYYGSANPFDTFEVILSLVRQKRINLDGLIKRRYGLDDINEAYADLARGEPGRGVIVY